MSAIAQSGNNASTPTSTDSPFRSQQSSQRPSKHLAPPGSSGLSTGALASLARGSLMMGLSSEGNASSTSLGVVSMHSNGVAGESSNTILAPNGVLVPRSSILLNRTNRKSFVDQWRLNDTEGVQPAPAVLRIPAVPTLKEQKERELQREFERAEREKEIERAIREKEQAEKVWGIPRKAFYLGLGEINFNAQMAMMAGWGNGSGGMGVDVANRKPLTSKAARRKSAPITLSPSSQSKKKNPKIERPSSSHSHSKRNSMSSTRETSHSTAPPKEPDLSDSDESIDLEELAALNAIINTRRSMEAAQALASGGGMYAARPNGTLKRNTSSQDGKRKSVDNNEPSPLSTDVRQESQESVPTLANNTNSGVGESESENGSTRRRPLIDRNQSDQASYLTAKIKFAPLPMPYSPSEAPQSNENEILASNSVVGNQTSLETDTSVITNGTDKLPGNSLIANSNGNHLSTEKEEMEAEGEIGMEGDESLTRRFGGSRSSKWYLMGMPKSVFSPQSYRALRRPVSFGSNENPVNGSFDLSSSPAHERRLSNILSESEKRGRRRSRGKRPANSRASSIKSRSSSVGSIDEEEREKRRQLILASRPGGTGMVTLPDGRKIRARRVGENYSDDEEEDVNSEWGFGRLARAAERQSFGDIERTSGEKRMSDDEGGRESDFGEGAEEGEEVRAMANMKRRKRELDDERKIKNQSDRDGLASETIQDASHDTILQMNQRKTNDDRLINAEEQVVFEESPEGSGSESVMTSEEANEEENVEEIQEDGLESNEQNSMPKRSVTLPSGPITLSASQAAEVRRRHEEEVAALGAEVLHSIAQSKKAKQMQIDQQQSNSRQQNQTSQQQKGNEHSKHANHDNRPSRSHTMHIGIPSSSSTLPTKASADILMPSGDKHRGRERLTRTQSSAADDAVKEKRHSRQSRISPLPQSLRSKVRTQSVHVLNSQKQVDSDKYNSHDTANPIRKPFRKDTGSTISVPLHTSRTSTPPRIQTDSARSSDRPVTPINKTISPTSMDDEEKSADLTASISSIRTLRGGTGDRSPPLDDHAIQSSPLSKIAVNAESFQSFIEPGTLANMTESPPTATRVLLGDNNDETIDSQVVDSSSSSIRTASAHSLRRSRIPDLPSPWNLPRRPDVRGYAVVPLPGNQLGRRPERPLEGRVWRSDEEQEDEVEEGYSSLDEYDDDETTEIEKRRFGRNSRAAQEDSDDEQESDLDAEELAEEERRTAVQKKRATTRAAGAELVSGLATKHKNQSQKGLPSISNRNRSSSANRSRDRQGDVSNNRSSQLGKSTEFPISAALSSSRRQGKSSYSSNHSQSTTRSFPREGSNDGKISRPVLSRTVVSASRDRKGNPVAKISRERDTWNDFDENDLQNLGEIPKQELIKNNVLNANELDSSDVDDLWPPTLDNSLGGTTSPIQQYDLPPPINIPLRRTTSKPTFLSTSAKSTSSFSSSIGSGTGAMSNSGIENSKQTSENSGHGLQHRSSSNSAIRLALHATKAKVIREKREKEQKEFERERRKQVREMDESIDFGWPKSLQGSSLY